MQYGWVLSMQVFEYPQKIMGPAQDLRLGEWFAAQIQEFSEVIARNELHDEKVAIQLAEKIHHLGQSLVTQVGEQRGFAFKGLARFAVTCGGGLFQRNDAVDALVHGFIDSTHAAVAELAHDAITILENCAGG